MSKIKMRCSQCGKSFKSASAKQLLCPECEERARRARQLKAKGPQPGAGTPPPAPPRVAPVKTPAPPARSDKPKQHWLDQERDLKVAAPEPKETARPPRLDTPMRREQPQPSSGRTLAGPLGRTQQPSFASPVRHAPFAAAGPRTTAAPAPKRSEPTRPLEKAAPHKKHEGERYSRGRPAAPPTQRPKREPIAPFSPTADQKAVIEKRYLELAQPHEVDGLRSQIANELGIPKVAVKRVVAALRERLNLPSWWEIKAYQGTSEDKARIQLMYTSFLPLPPVGVHKQIAETLHLPAGVVYQAIKAIRSEMNLPQYNPPESHGLPPAATQPAPRTP